MTAVPLTALLLLIHCTCMGRCTARPEDKGATAPDSLSGALARGQDEGMPAQATGSKSPPTSPEILTEAPSPSPPSSKTSQTEPTDEEHHTPEADTSPSHGPAPSPGEEILIDGLTVEERAFRIAMLRRQLLDKLGLTDLPPPPDEPYRSLPSAIKKRLINHQPPQRDLPRYEPAGSQITEVLSYAENYTKGCPDAGFCFRFRLVRDILVKHIKSVHLWIFLTSSSEINRSPIRRLTIWLLLDGESEIKRKELATKVVSKREGWFHLELPREMNDWRSLEYRIQLTNAAMDPNQTPQHAPAVSLAREELPILTVAINENKHHQRSRRQTTDDTCPANPDTCCLHPFQVDLTQVLGGIVEHPQNIMANFCRGSCIPAINFDTVHAKMMRDRALIESDDNLRQDLLPCCVPASYDRDESMLIRLSSGILSRLEVAEVSANSCICK